MSLTLSRKDTLHFQAELCEALCSPLGSLSSPVAMTEALDDFLATGVGGIMDEEPLADWCGTYEYSWSDRYTFGGCRL